MNAHVLAPALVFPFVAWRIYVRVRRNIGPQPMRPGRMIASIVIFSLVSLLLAALTWRHWEAMEGLGAGLLLGAPLGWVGLGLTRFETRPSGRFYTPNAYLGVALSLLLVGRLAYRFGQIFTATKALGAPGPGAMWSPLTLAAFGVMAGYYITYYAGVLKRHR